MIWLLVKTVKVDSWSITWDVQLEICYVLDWISVREGGSVIT